jgi:hypothetical protein
VEEEPAPMYGEGAAEELDDKFLRWPGPASNDRRGRLDMLGDIEALGGGTESELDV